ncbi:hypothetical protein CC1G_10252 [Coprinopsis cinerea okayama7|uniref:F-box domain-containing protein n=1 Tax=Coprinopsis cinerea (strain Okayama-7 / 130 / ATCC MYA-4618 / FGSC 9003) TaxID=240176 RepID=A8NPF3_COPC7|nr:hypothetical protein CC1G_10252 [Coprinopsis cinerea okayama7\|eukprot:XP_001835325.2 hypothetical protein CC1G_10252 [Coprinopsis cinerea okayama7\
MHPQCSGTASTSASAEAQAQARAEDSLRTRDAITNRRRTANFRRRSLKSLSLFLPSPGNGNSSSSRPNSFALGAGWTAVGKINADVVREIADLLAPSDILSFSMTSSQLRYLLLPALYETVVLKSSKNCRRTLKMLQTKRHLCRHIRKLAVRPNYYLAWPQQDDYLDEGWVVDRLIDLADDLKGLVTFDWDGLEVPDDRLWDTLRLKCPLLKSVFTNIGQNPLNPETSLFSFTDLTSFSVIVRHGLPGSELFPTPEALPPRFWDMILTRCPNLEELSICSFSSSARVFDFDRIVEGSWPKLNSLTLGSFGYQEDFALGPSTALGNGELARFLEDHPTLKYIRFLWNFKRWMSPDVIPLDLSPDALPKLDTFIGVYQQLAVLPNLKEIETVDLTCEPVYESRLRAVCDALKSCERLTSLDVWVHLLDPNRDHTSFFKAIVGSCPKLTDLHLMCTTSFTVKPLKQLLSQLRLLPNLKRFSLTKGHKYLDESMLETATRILKDLPSLKQISIRWARESCPNHLKQEGLYDVVTNSSTGDVEGMMVVERGIPLVGPSFRRRYFQKVEVSAGEAKREGGETGGKEWQKEVVRRGKVVKRRMSSIWSMNSVSTV